MNVILKAAQFAEKKHRDQERKYTGEPFIIHPGRVALHVSLLPDATEEMVAAAWLHDTVEDTDATLDEIKIEFGDIIAKLIEELTDNTSQLRASRETRKATYRNQLSKASTEAKQIKLVDRIDNLLDMDDIDFLGTYVIESTLLLRSIGDADVDLANRLNEVIENKRRLIHRLAEWNNKDKGWNE